MNNKWILTSEREPEKEDLISVYEKEGGKLLRELCDFLEERKEREEE